MYNEEIINLFEEVNKTIEKIQKRTSMVLTVNDFLLSDAGMEKLDAACMLLQTIGENIKTIDNKTNQELLSQYKVIPWKMIIGMRDFISHHYSGVDPFLVFDTIKESRPVLHDTINQILIDLRSIS